MHKVIPQLDARLTVAASLVKEGAAVADIGCDHGKLALHLAASRRFPKVIGTDLRQGPLDKATFTLRRAGREDSVELRLGDGLSVLHEGEVGTVIIAGVSAQTTIDILEAAPWQWGLSSPRLVLVPATKHAVLRKWLLVNGFGLLRDCPVQVAGHWYAVMAAEYTGAAKLPTECTLRELVYGKTEHEEYFAQYAQVERGKLKKERRRFANDHPMALEMDALFAQAEIALHSSAEQGD